MYKFVLLFTVLFFTFILWVIFMANTGQSTIFFKLVKTVPYGDKLGHFGLFGILTLALNFITNFKCFKLGCIKLYYGTLAVTVFVIFEELSQYYIPNRTLDVYDFLADAVGISLFTLFSYFIAQKRHFIKP